MNKVRDFLKGKKTFLMAAIGLLGAVVAWADGQIDLVGLCGAAWAAAQSVFIRVAIAGPVQPAKADTETPVNP